MFNIHSQNPPLMDYNTVEGGGKETLLSNTATPRYYGEFRDAVIRGEIPVCHTIEMEMNRIDRLIKNPNYYYDPDATERYIRFCENELTLTDGSDLHLLNSFKLWAESILGWYEFVDMDIYDPQLKRTVKRTIKQRLVNKQYLIVARGAAKTLYDSSLQAYYLTCDPKTTEQIVTAPTMKMAEEMLQPISTAITRAKGPAFQFLTDLGESGSDKNRKLRSTKKGIQNFLTDSIIKILPMRIDKLQGLHCKVATIDEWLSVDIREDPIGAIEQGASKVSNYLIVATSSEGTVRNGPGDDVKIELMKILKGEYAAPNVSIWWYKLDDVKEVNDQSMWIKANPNLGKTVTYEVYKRDVDRAENAPAARNDIIAKRFGLPMEGYTYFFTYEEIKNIAYPQNYDKMQCALGCDLSQGGDFCSFTFLFPLSDGRFGIKTIDYISEYTMAQLPASMRVKYESFQREGSLVVMPGTILRMMDVYDDLDAYIQKHEYDVCCVGYDPYNAKEFIERWCTENSPFGVEKVIQGAKTESVPLTELKKLAEQKMLVFDQDLFSYTMGNCIVIQDTNGNKKLRKKSYEAKIDAVAALMDAFVAYKLNPDAFG